MRKIVKSLAIEARYIQEGLQPTQQLLLFEVFVRGAQGRGVGLKTGLTFRCRLQLWSYATTRDMQDGE